MYILDFYGIESSDIGSLLMLRVAHTGIFITVYNNITNSIQALKC